jgi:hypothetical protein
VSRMIKHPDSDGHPFTTTSDDGVSIFKRPIQPNATFSGLMTDVVESVAELLGTDYCDVLEPLPNGAAFILRAGIGWPNELIGCPVMSLDSSSPAGHVYFNGGAVAIKN